ncbi:hypothetical protein V7x_05530 [Crateriforma conspicua]|uniref:UPF0102 protein V7x_05530 n=1 Tax=Crateriforma conspicua TaxID=2527996 RepID=A0A5C6FQ51_9PLAN|nr:MULTISPECIES: YraN family protein [Crateriforma]TWU65009.1 hypothetical protein V7x_05530 [Crateriforma conspicua]
MSINRNIVADVLGRIRDDLVERYRTIRFGGIDDDGPIGRRGEQAAARLLRQKRLQIVAESESDRGGEIDLIAVDRRARTIVFVEVKTLATTKPGHPADRVDDQKQARITRAALRYLKRKRLVGTPCRFDVVAVWWPRDSARPQRLEHYPAAFEAAGQWQLY